MWNSRAWRIFTLVEVACSWCTHNRQTNHLVQESLELSAGVWVEADIGISQSDPLLLIFSILFINEILIEDLLE